MKTIMAITAVLFTTTLVWLTMSVGQAQAHTVTPQTCTAVAALYPPGQRRAVRTRCVRLAAKHAWAHDYQSCLRRATSIGRNKCVIRLVFGSWGGEAVSVAGCESTWNTRAENGQYKGLFQMGSHERATYGHGSTALIQSQSAHRYFVASGRDWSPWECKP